MSQDCLAIAGSRVFHAAEHVRVLERGDAGPVANNGLGFSVALTLVELEKIERFLSVLPDSPAVYGEWKRLVVQHNVLGSKVHDTKLVATMNVHGIRRILTFNTGDFTRYDIDPIHPLSLLS